MAKIKLRPCPFCGEEEPYMAQNYLGQKFVRCPNCGATMWGKDTDDWRIGTHGEKNAEKLAAEAWNRRATDEEVLKRVARILTKSDWEGRASDG